MMARRERFGCCAKLKVLCYEATVTTLLLNPEFISVFLLDSSLTVCQFMFGGVTESQ